MTTSWVVNGHHYYILYVWYFNLADSVITNDHYMGSLFITGYFIGTFETLEIDGQFKQNIQIYLHTLKTRAVRRIACDTI